MHCKCCNCDVLPEDFDTFSGICNECQEVIDSLPYTLALFVGGLTFMCLYPGVFLVP